MDELQPLLFFIHNPLEKILPRIFKLAVTSQWSGSTFFPIHQPALFLQANLKLGVDGSLLTLVISYETICEILDKYNCFQRFSRPLVSGCFPTLMNILCLSGLWVCSFLWEGVEGCLSILPVIGDTMEAFFLFDLMELCEVRYLSR